MNRSAVVSEVRSTVPDVIAIHLFGSMARGDVHRESDVDLAILSGAKIPTAALFDLTARLETLLHRSVDLVDLRAASAVLRVQVLGDAELLDDADSIRRAEFECFALADYARLNEERAGILADVYETRRVHG